MSFGTATRSIFSWKHNEFWNIWTDVMPLIYFANVLLQHLPLLTADSPVKDQAFIYTVAGTVFQHSVSLVAHTYNCLSMDTSNSIWSVDYAGIGINFLWNTPPLLFILYPSLEQYWSNIVPFCMYYSVVTVAFALYCSKVSILGAHKGGVGHWLLAFSFGLPLPACMLSTAWVGWSNLQGHPDLWMGRVIAVLLGVAFSIKNNYFPDRHFEPGTLEFTPLTSHVIWHILVWICQRYYFLLYIAQTPMLAYMKEAVAS